MGRPDPRLLSRRLRAAVTVVLGAGAAWGCAQIIGVDEERQIFPVGQGGGGFDGGTADVPVEGDRGGCQPGEKRCNGACVARSIEYGCGAADCAPCSLANAERVVCKDDRCTATTCKPGFGACGDLAAGCNADLTSPETCTNCTTKCAPGQVCAPSGCGADCGALTNCNGSCVDRQTSTNHCGACANVCASAANGDPTCAGGVCSVVCRPGYAHCDGNPAGPCAALTVFYRDSDGDGFGETGATKLACSQAEAGGGWIAAAGDCHDGNPEVRPNQAGFFGTPYTSPANQPSYDYDCTGVEVEQPGTAHFTQCSAICNESGFVPAGSGRAGGGVNDYCGSPNVGLCFNYYGCSPITYDAGTPNPCH